MQGALILPFRQSHPQIHERDWTSGNTALEPQPSLIPATAPKVLRPYQEKLVGDVRAAMAGGARRVCAQLPVGGGKTVTAAAMVMSALAKGRKVAFTVPMTVLIDQTVEGFRAQGIERIGVMQADHPLTNDLAPVQVISVQTLSRRKAMRPEVGLVIVDEAHQRSQAIVDWMAEKPSLRFVGLTATPGRAGMAEEWDALVNGVSMAELIKAGFLSDYRVLAPHVPDLSGLKLRAGEYKDEDLSRVMGDAKVMGDVVTTWLERGDGRPTIAFCVDRAHARAIADRFTAAGIASAYVDGETDPVELRWIEREFRAGRVRVVANCRKLTTGLDWPVGCIVDAAPTASKMLYVQRIGRGLRVNPEAPGACIILDHAGNTLRHGFVSDLDWTRFPDAKATVAGPREKPVRMPRTCSKCTTLMAPGATLCQTCGHVSLPPRIAPDAAEGDLVELRRQEAKAAKREFAAMSMEDKAAWYAGLKSFALSRGKKEGYAYHLYAERFGTYPASSMRHVLPRHHDEASRWAKANLIRKAKARAKAEGRA